MSNKYLSQELYNEEFKNGFLDAYKSSKTKGDDEKKTSTSYRYIFQKSFTTESQLGKDIYDFNDAELNTLLHSYNNGSVYVVSSTVSILRQYLDYCVSKGYIRVNLLQDLSGYDDFEKFVDKNTQQNKYISREEFERIIDDCINAQDAYPIAMAYYGFKGEDCCEITNLKTEHVNRIESSIYIENRNKTFDIDEFLMNIIIDAIEETEYKKNLTDGATAPKTDSFVIFPNDYVMRVANCEDNSPAKGSNIGARLKRVKTYTGNAYITITSIWYSGMLDKAREMYAEKGEMNKEDWIQIGEMYGVAAEYWSKTRQRFESMLTAKDS